MFCFFRIVEKYAMLVGGVDTHRMDLSSMIMLKDNHINAHGSITNAVKEALSVFFFFVFFLCFTLIFPFFFFF